MIISGNMFSFDELGNELALLRTDPGLRTVWMKNRSEGREPHTVACRSLFSSFRGCDVTLDYGNRTCTFDSAGAYLLHLDISVSSLDGTTIYNDTFEYLLARNGKVYVDCWSVGTDTHIECVANAWAIFGSSERHVVAPYDEVIDNTTALRGLILNEEICDEIADTVALPIGYPGHPLTGQFSNQVTGLETRRIGY